MAGRQQQATFRKGFTLVEVIVSMAILMVLVLALGTAILETIRLEMLSRETAAAQQGLAAKIAEYYGSDRATLVALSVNGEEFDLTGTNNENLRPLEGSVQIGSLTAREVDPVTLTPLGGAGSSDYFELTARADWQGMNGENHTELVAYVLAEE